MPVKKFCPNCDTGVESITTSGTAALNFCSNCGARFEEVDEQTPPRMETVNAKELIISEMLANVWISPSIVSGITVTITGDEATKQAAEVKIAGNAVMISAPFPFMEGRARSQGGTVSTNRFGGNVIMSSGSFVGDYISTGTSMINGQLYIDGRAVNMDREIWVTVEVPIGTTIKIGKLVGTCKVGDVSGDLVTNIRGMTNVLAGKVRSLTAAISGSGDVSVDSVDGGTVEVTISGSGSVSIYGGKAVAFNATVSGSGDVTFRGVAGTASLGVSGSGDIYLAECESAPLKRKSGSGSIRIGKYPKTGGNEISDW